MNIRKNVGSNKILGRKRILVQKNLLSKFFFDDLENYFPTINIRKNVGSNKVFGPKKDFGLKKIFRLKKVLVQ